jgi:hypothetical protein
MLTTKNWYREETDMWAEFGRRTPFGKRFSSEHSVEASVVGSTSSFGRRAVPQMRAEAFGSTWWRRLNTKKKASRWWIRDGHDAIMLILGNKYCNRGRLGVMLESGYKYKPLVFVIGIEQFHKNRPRANSWVLLVVSSSSSRGVIDPSTSVSTGNLVSCLVSCGGFKLGSRRFLCWIMSHVVG